MTISVPDSAKALIEKQAAKAGYADSAEYLLALVERDRHSALREEIESKLAEAVSSPSSPMTPQDWKDIREQGRRMIERGKRQ